ncbi:MAG: fibronectin type III domain-containing protein [Lachnospiraceae bacterium]|nr:fibronectin type III domain-containing protein [Lachnospiraceae bacterium]
MNKQTRKLSVFSLAFVFTTLILLCLPKTDVYAAKAKVSNVTQTFSTTETIALSWNAPSEIEHFTVYISEFQNFPEYATRKSLTYDTKDYIGELEPNKTYFVKVLPYDNNITYDFSDVITCCTNPEIVTDLSHTASTTSSVTVAWNAPPSGAEYYNIYYIPCGSYGEKIYAGTTANKRFTVSNLAPDTEYNIYVYSAKKSQHGYEAEGFDSYEPFCATLADAKAFSNFKLSRYAASSSTATITFDNNCRNQDGVEIEICTLAGKKIKTIKGNWTYSYFDFSSNKIKNTGFKYRLRSYIKINNKYFYGPYTKANVVVAHPKVTATKKSNSSLKLKWSKITGAKSYTVYMSKKVTGKYKKIATVKTNTYILKKLKPSQDYYIYVKANNVKSGNKKYGSTKPKHQPIVNVCYSKYSKKVKNYYTTYVNN